MYNTMSIKFRLYIITILSINVNVKDVFAQSTLIWPINNHQVSQSYGIESNSSSNCPKCFHTALDIVSTSGDTRIMAAADGTARVYPMGYFDPGQYDDNHGMGNIVIIEHDNGLYTIYAHMAEFYISDYHRVRAGELIGRYGRTGFENSTRKAHLHFEVRLWGIIGNRDDNGGPRWGYSIIYPNLSGYLNPWPFLELNVDFSTKSVVNMNGNQSIKTGPGSGYTQELAQVVNNQKFYAFASWNGWYLIHVPSKAERYQGGMGTGWVKANLGSGRYVRIVDSVRGLDAVNVRSQPNSSSTVLSGVYDLQRFPLLDESKAGSGCEKEWYQIPLASNSGNSTGWICGRFAEIGGGTGGCPECGGTKPNLVVKSVDAPSSAKKGENLKFNFILAENNAASNFEQLVEKTPFDIKFHIVNGNRRTNIGNQTNATSVSWTSNREKKFDGRADIPSNLSPGRYEIIIEVDTDNDVDESDENDNEFSFFIEVEDGSTKSDKPNLIVKSVDAPVSVKLGEEISFRFVVAEINKAPDYYQLVTQVAFAMTYYLNREDGVVKIGDRLNTTNVLWPYNRERNFSARADIPSNLSPGRYEIIIEVDTDNDVDESDENDNEFSFFIEVEGATSEAVTANIGNYDIEIIQPYPNPMINSSTFKIRSLINQFASVSVVDLVGRTVLSLDQVRLKGEHYTEINLDVSNLPAGNYILNVKTVNASKSMPIVILR